MRCPFCSSEDTAVKDSRPTEDGSAIRRRRICQACGSRFTTFERVQLRELIVIKRNSSREAFDRDKLARAVFTALRKRPIESERAERMITGIIRRLEATGDTEIASKTIGEMVMESLITLDPVAYVRFASVYKDFKNVQDFEKFLTSIEEQPKGN
ncbi:MAG: transcriptional repressor NrdR [Alphaproteobacteria bacterium]|nr:transcriptional repressor NrdR [Alphaproteobacteria bacterium]OJV44959.1 MAG: transcriptional regulator NrdR [Alphaproteobacteria bacterium 43-37]